MMLNDNEIAKMIIDIVKLRVIMIVMRNNTSRQK